MSDTEQHRLQEAHENGQAWYRWGPYLSERQWGTVREDYSPGGTASLPDTFKMKELSKGKE